MTVPTPKRAAMGAPSRGDWVGDTRTGYMLALLARAGVEDWFWVALVFVAVWL